MQEWNYLKKKKRGKLKNLVVYVQKAFSRQQEGKLQVYNGIRRVFSSEKSAHWRVLRGPIKNTIILLWIVEISRTHPKAESSNQFILTDLTWLRGFLFFFKKHIFNYIFKEVYIVDPKIYRFPFKYCLLQDFPHTQPTPTLIIFFHSSNKKESIFVVSYLHSLGLSTKEWTCG